MNGTATPSWLVRASARANACTDRWLVNERTCSDCVLEFNSCRWCGRLGHDCECLCRLRTPACAARRTNLINGSRPPEVVELTVGQPWRYYTALDCGVGKRRVCFVFKNRTIESALLGASAADGLRFGTPVLVLPSTWREARMTHNTAVRR